MKKIIVLTLTILIFVIVGIGLNLEKTEELGNLYSCDFGDYTVYNKENFLYFQKTDEHWIYTKFGIYKLKPEKDGWLLKLHIDKYEDTIHASYMKWIEEKKRPTGGKVSCNKIDSEDEFPGMFKFFIDNHRLIFKTQRPDVVEKEA